MFKKLVALKLSLKWSGANFSWLPKSSETISMQFSVYFWFVLEAASYFIYIPNAKITFAGSAKYFKYKKTDQPPHHQDQLSKVFATNSGKFMRPILDVFPTNSWQFFQLSHCDLLLRIFMFCFLDNSRLMSYDILTQIDTKCNQGKQYTSHSSGIFWLHCRDEIIQNELFM